MASTTPADFARDANARLQGWAKPIYSRPAKTLDHIATLRSAISGASGYHSLESLDEMKSDLKSTLAWRAAARKEARAVASRARA